MSEVLAIFGILTPLLLIAAFGAYLRWRFEIDLATLGKLNLYFFVPVFVFQKVVTSDLSWAEMGGVAALSVTQVAALGLIVLAIGRVFHVARGTLAAVALAVMFYNSGNYGLPLADLAFGGRGAAVQAFVLMTQNVLTFTVGLAIAVLAGSGTLVQGLAQLVRMPVLPTLILALGTKWWLSADPTHQLPKPLMDTARYIADGLVPVALATLGAQLASNPRWPRWKPVSAVIALRLVVAPLLMMLLLWVTHYFAAGANGHAFLRSMDLWPWPAQLMILTAATPTALNTLLLTLELRGDAQLAADCVFWTTISSIISISAWLAFVRWAW